MIDARALRDLMGQASWTLREYRNPRRILLQHRVDRALVGPRLPRAPRVAGSVWGVSVVRDEADVIAAVLRHHLDQGLAGLIVADNGSTDGTWEIVQRLAAADPRVHPFRDTWPRHDQSEKISRLARLAGRAGADWVVPFDGDEFWFARGGTLAESLAELSATEPDLTLLYVDWFTLVPLGGPDEAWAEREFLLDSEPVFPGKVLVRTHPLLTIAQGNHAAARVGRSRKGEFAIAHVPYRGEAQVARKLRRGAAAESSSSHPVAWHWEAGAALGDGAVADAWQRMRAGRPVPEIAVPAVGPLVRVRPLGWRTWDPNSEVPRAAAAGQG